LFELSGVDMILGVAWLASLEGELENFDYEFQSLWAVSASLGRTIIIQNRGNSTSTKAGKKEKKK